MKPGMDLMMLLIDSGLSGRRATTNKNLVLTGFLWYHSVYLLCVLGAVYVHFEKAQLSFNIHNHTLKKLI